MKNEQFKQLKNIIIGMGIMILSSVKIGFMGTDIASLTLFDKGVFFMNHLAWIFGLLTVIVIKLKD